jgi:hypothetical protein
MRGFKMTQPLRRTHLWIWIALALLLPLLLVSGVTARRTTTPINSTTLWEKTK